MARKSTEKPAEAPESDETPSEAPRDPGTTHSAQIAVQRELAAKARARREG